MHPQFEPLEAEISRLIFDVICRAQTAGIEAEELYLGLSEMEALDCFLLKVGDMLPVELNGNTIQGGLFFGLRVKPMAAAGAAAR